MKQDEKLCLPAGIVMNGNKPKPRKEKPGEDTRAKMVAALSLGGGPRLIFVVFFCIYFIQQIFMEQLLGPALFKALGALQLIALPSVSQMCLMKMLLFNGKMCVF